MNIRSSRLILSLLAAAVCATTAACNVGPNYQRPPVPMSTTYKSAATQAAPATQPTATQPAATRPAVTHLATNWWLLFDDTELNALEDATLKENQDIKAAMARIDEARALARITKSGFYPQISFNPSAIRQRSPGGSSGASARTFTSTSIPLDLSYEVDIWGQVRRAYEASKAQVRFSLDDYAVVLQTAQADVATDYFTLRSLDTQDDILLRNVETFRKQVVLTQSQFKAGLVSQLDVAQAVAQLNSTITMEVDIRRVRADTEHALAILIGRAPAEVTLPVRDRTVLPPVITAGLPTELLRHRPDVAEAEENLIAANAQVGVAISQFYPVLRITGAAGFQSLNLQDALNWENRIWQLGPSISAPIFTGGQLEGGVEQAKARYQELLANFRTAVLSALQDVEDSLNDLNQRAAESRVQDEAVKASRDAVRLSQSQYQNGLVNYLQVIDADRTLLSNELAAEQILEQRMISTVVLIKALGGGWDAQTVADTQKAPATQSATTKP